jgi:single-strand DNA-binding protein
MNKYLISGNLTKDAEVKDVVGRKAINFSIAHNKFYKDKNGDKLEKTTFFNAVIWRDENVNIAKFLTKGTKVIIEAEPEPEMYKNKDGETVCAIKLIVHDIELIGGGTRPSDSTNNNSTGNDKDLPF